MGDQGGRKMPPPPTTTTTRATTGHWHPLSTGVPPLRGARFRAQTPPDPDIGAYAHRPRDWRVAILSTSGCWPSLGGPPLRRAARFRAQTPSPRRGRQPPPHRRPPSTPAGDGARERDGIGGKRAGVRAARMKGTVQGRCVTPRDSNSKQQAGANTRRQKRGPGRSPGMESAPKHTHTTYKMLRALGPAASPGGTTVHAKTKTRSMIKKNRGKNSHPT